MKRTDNSETVAQFWDGRSERDLPRIFWTVHPIINEYVNAMIAPGSENFLEWFAGETVKGKPFERGVSLGCGTGDSDRKALKANVCKRLDGIDISEKSLEKARQAAARAGLADRVHYAVGDLNAIDLPEARYDFALFSGSLHHVEKLERLCVALKKGLKPGAAILLNEYVGPTRLQWTEKQLDVINRIWAILPPEYRRPEPVSAVDEQTMAEEDPSESVRSQDIIPLLYEHFEVVAHIDYGGSILMPLWAFGVAPDIFFDRPTRDRQTIVKLLCLIEELAREETDIPVCYAQLVLRNAPPTGKRPSDCRIQQDVRTRWTDFWLPEPVSDGEAGLLKKAYLVLKREGFRSFIAGARRHLGRL